MSPQPFLEGSEGSKGSEELACGELRGHDDSEPVSRHRVFKRLERSYWNLLL